MNLLAWWKCDGDNTDSTNGYVAQFYNTADYSLIPPRFVDGTSGQAFDFSFPAGEYPITAGMLGTAPDQFTFERDGEFKFDFYSYVYSPKLIGVNFLFFFDVTSLNAFLINQTNTDFIISDYIGNSITYSDVIPLSQWNHVVTYYNNGNWSVAINDVTVAPTSGSNPLYIMSAHVENFMMGSTANLWMDVDHTVYMDEIKIYRRKATSFDFTSNIIDGTTALNVGFQDLSIDDPYAWLWHFGDGTTSTSRNPTHTYLGSGMYTVTLDVTNTVTSKSVTKTNYITAYINRDRDPKKVLFTNTSTNSPTTYSWDFGDGSYSSERNPSNIYSDYSSSYLVTLNVSNSGGSDSTQTNIQTGVPPARSDFTCTVDESNNKGLHFSNMSTGGVYSYIWHFEDTSSTTKNPTHTFRYYNQNYPVSLVSIGNYGLDKTTSIVNVGSWINADFVWTNTDRPKTIDFFDLSLTGTPITRWDWTFGDGSYSTDQTPTHTYASYSTDYTAILVIHDASGLSDWTQNIVHTEAPMFMVAGYGSINGLDPEARYSHNGADWTLNGVFTGDASFTYNASARGMTCNSDGTWLMGINGDWVKSILYSTDGLRFNYTNDSNLFTITNSVATNDIIWVAGGTHGGWDNISPLAYSYNGFDWTLSNFQFPYESYGGDFINIIKYNGTMFLAGGLSGEGSHELAYSYNGLDWTDILNPFGNDNPPSSGGVTGIAWDGSAWMIVSPDYSNVLSISSNGIDWTPVTPVGLDIGAPYTIATNGSRWAMAGRKGSGNSTLAYSDDGSNWTSLGIGIITSGGSGYPQLDCNGQTFVVTNDEVLGRTNSLGYSYDGSSWVGLARAVCGNECQAVSTGTLDALTLVAWYKFEDNLADSNGGPSFSAYSCSPSVSYQDAVIDRGIATLYSYQVPLNYFDFRMAEVYIKIGDRSYSEGIFTLGMYDVYWSSLNKISFYYDKSCFGAYVDNDATPVFRSGIYSIDASSWAQFKVFFNGHDKWDMYVRTDFSASYTRLTQTPITYYPFSNLPKFTAMIPTAYPTYNVNGFDELKLYGSDPFTIVDFAAYPTGLSVDFFTNFSGADSLGDTLWYFGDGETGTSTMPNHVYAEGGTYKVTLRTTCALTGRYCYSTSDIVVTP